MKTTNLSKPNMLLIGILLCFALFQTKPCRAQLNGTYTIDAGRAASAANYKDFHSAICDLDSGKRYDGGIANGSGVKGTVVFEVADGTYNEANTITAIPGSSIANTVTFISKSGDSSKVIVAHKFFAIQTMFVLNEVSNIRFYGISFKVQVDTGSGSGDIFILNQVSNFTISHCVFSSPSTHNNNYGIVSQYINGVTDSNEVITDNVFRGVWQAIYLFGPDKYTIVQNNLADTGSGFFYGYHQDYCQVDNNIISGYGIGIALYSTAHMLSITGNRVYADAGILLDTVLGTSARHGLIANNAINAGSGALTIKGSDYTDVYQNNMYAVNSYATVILSHSLHINFVNNSVQTLLTYPSYPKYRTMWVDSCPGMVCDYNNYYPHDSLWTKDSTAYNTLADWQSATGFDIHAVSYDPKYVLTNYLQTHNVALLGKGTPLSSVKYDILGDARSTTAPTIGAYESIVLCLTGTYTIDPGQPASSGNYLDFHSAMADLDFGKRDDGGPSNGTSLCGPVVFKVADGTYNERDTITAIPGSSATNTVTFESASGDSSKVVLTTHFDDLSQGRLLTVSGASNIILKGMSFVADNSSYNSSTTNDILHIGGVCHNIEVSRCAFVNKLNIWTNGIVAAPDSGQTDSNIVIKNNYFKFLLHSVQLGGAGYDTTYNTTVQNNEGDSLIGGFFIGYSQANCLIINNTVRGMGSGDASIALFNSKWLQSISGNRINSSVNGIYINGLVCKGLSHGLIANNTLNTEEWGINAVNAKYLDIDYNNVYVSSGYGQVIGAHIDHLCQNINLLNNNIEVNFTYNGGSSQVAAIWIDSTKSMTNCDYNNYYATHGDTLMHVGSSRIFNLSAWVGSTGLDLHSYNVNPVYDFNNYLKTGNTNLEGKGIPVSAITKDITGIMRSNSAPTIGAYEIEYQDSITVCKNSCTGLVSPITGIKYLWSTGDTTKTITYCPTASGPIYVKVWVDSITGDTINFPFKIALTKTTCVWPGDANADAVDNIYDVLAIGVAFGDTGSTRVNATTDWTGQPCNDWSGSFVSGANHKNADCNGNGTVDSTDLAAISLNFSKTHLKADAVASGNPADAPLTISFSKDSVQAGDTVTAIFSLGSGKINATNVYGIALGIDYSGGIAPQSMMANFNNSWLGNHLVDLVVNDSTNRKIYIGLSRIDHTNVSGSGQIAKLSLYMPDNVAGKREVKAWFKMQITEYKCIDASENIISLNPIGDSIKVYEFKSGIDQASANDSRLTIFPNPATSSIHIKAEGNIIQKVEITDALGRSVYQSENNNSIESDISVGSLSSGVYLINITTPQGLMRSRFVKE